MTANETDIAGSFHLKDIRHLKDRRRLRSTRSVLGGALLYDQMICPIEPRRRAALALIQAHVNIDQSRFLRDADACPSRAFDFWRVD
jgi:hypothetical protein